jgi:hypothetical protein
MLATNRNSGRRRGGKERKGKKWTRDPPDSHQLLPVAKVDAKAMSGFSNYGIDYDRDLALMICLSPTHGTKTVVAHGQKIGRTKEIRCRKQRYKFIKSNYVQTRDRQELMVAAPACLFFESD